MTAIQSSSPILLSPSVLESSMINNLNTDQTALATVENQLSSGNAVTQPSDNPAGAANILQLQGSLTRANQYASNAANGVSWLSLGNSTVNSVLNVLQSLQSTVEGLSGNSLTGGSATITATQTAATGALNQLLNLANTTEAGGQPIFAGTGGGSAAYNADGAYLGNNTAPTRTVAPGTQVAIATTGPQIFGDSTTTAGLLGTGSGGTAVGVLQQIVNDLGTAASATTTSARTAAISQVTGADLQNLNTAITTVENAAGALGTNEQTVQSFSVQATNSATSILGELSSVQDTNVAQATTNLQLEQDAYQSALYATSQLSTDALVKYL